MDKNAFMSVRFASGSIRIFKDAIRMMDSPKFIRFSVNEEGTLLAIEPFHKKSFTSFKIPRNLYSYNGAMIVYSKPLCSLLYNRLKWNKNKLYRIPGRILKEQKVAVFDLTNADCYKSNSSNEAI